MIGGRSQPDFSFCVARDWATFYSSKGNRMTEAAFVAQQMSEPYPPGIEQHFWTLSRNKTILREIHAAEAKAGRLGRILEIGCGPGIVLKYLRDHGVDCDGVEPSPIVLASDIAERVRSGIDCFEVPERERKNYDALLLLDVLEHIAAPVDFLRQIRLAYPKARALIITVPARNELWSNYDDHFGHFRRYSLRSVHAELRGANYNSVDARYFFHALYPVMFGIKVWQGKRSTTTRAPNRPKLHRFMADFFDLEARLLPKSLPGTSIIACANN